MVLRYPATCCGLAMVLVGRAGDRQDAQAGRMVGQVDSATIVERPVDPLHMVGPALQPVMVELSC